MASGQEMALTAAMNMLFKIFGVNADQTKADIVKAIGSVLSFDTRLTMIEQNQLLIMAALKIEPMEKINGENETAGSIQ